MYRRAAKEIGYLTRRVFVVWDEKGLQRSSYHSVGYWNCLKTISRLIVRFVNPLLGNLVFLLLLIKEKVHERLSFKLFSHQLLTTMKYNISKSISQLEDDRQLMKTHGTNAWWCAKQAASRAPTYMKPGTEVLGMKGTSLRTEQQKTTLCGSSGIIYQINSQGTFHKPQHKKAWKEDGYSY